MFNSIFGTATGSAGLQEMSICGGCALLCGFIIAIVHKLTTNYTKNFLTTITILPFLVAMVIVMVNGNLGTSVAILGAFSLVRFRSIPGNSKEILSVFFAMTVGLALGMGTIGLGALITAVGCLAIIIFSKTNLFSNSANEKILKITIPENLDYTNIFDKEFLKYTSSSKLVNVKTTNMGSLFDLTYNVVLKKGVNEKNFIDDLRIKNGNLKIVLTHELTGSDL